MRNKDTSCIKLKKRKKKLKRLYIDGLTAYFYLQANYQSYNLSGWEYSLLLVAVAVLSEYRFYVRPSGFRIYSRSDMSSLGLILT